MTCPCLPSCDRQPGHRLHPWTRCSRRGSRCGVGGRPRRHQHATELTHWKRPWTGHVVSPPRAALKGPGPSYFGSFMKRKQSTRKPITVHNCDVQDWNTRDSQNLRFGFLFLTADSRPAKLLLDQTMCFCQRCRLHWSEGGGSWGAVSHRYQRHYWTANFSETSWEWKWWLASRLESSHSRLTPLVLMWCWPANFYGYRSQPHFSNKTCQVWCDVGEKGRIHCL